MSDEIGVRVWPSKSSQNIRQNENLIHYNAKVKPIYGGGAGEPIIDYDRIKNERTRTFNSVDMPALAAYSAPKTSFRHSDHPHFAKENVLVNDHSGSPAEHERDGSTSGDSQSIRADSVAYREKTREALAHLDYVIADDEHRSNQSSGSRRHSNQSSVSRHHSNPSSLAEHRDSHHSSIVEHHFDNHGSEVPPPSRPHYEPISMADIFPATEGHKTHEQQGHSVLTSGRETTMAETESHSNQHHGHEERHEENALHHHEHHEQREGDHHDHHEYEKVHHQEHQPEEVTQSGHQETHQQEHHEHHDIHHEDHSVQQDAEHHEHHDKVHEHHDTSHKNKPEHQPTHADRHESEHVSSTHSEQSQAIADHHHHSNEETSSRQEPLAEEDIRAKLERMGLGYKQYATDPALHEPPVDYEPFLGQRPRSETEERRRHEQYMHAEKSDDYTSNVSAPVLTEDVIQDLRKMTQGIGSLAAIKAERREQALAREQEAREEIARIQAELTPQFFLSQTPKTFTGSDAPIPEWKRQMIAKKMAVAAAKKEEERIWCEFEEWKKQFEPNWKKTNNQRSSITNPQSP